MVRVVSLLDIVATDLVVPFPITWIGLLRRLLVVIDIVPLKLWPGLKFCLGSIGSHLLLCVVKLSTSKSDLRSDRDHSNWVHDPDSSRGRVELGRL
jgi:hypothetical protein